MENRSPLPGLTRRSFLETAAAGIGAVTVAGNTLTALAKDGTAGEPSEFVVQAACSPGDTVGCYLNIKVRDGKIVQTWPADVPEARYKKCCVRGLTHVQTVYSPKRLQYPMKRDPKYRGDDSKWERISWEQAVEEISTKLMDVADKYGEAANYCFGGGCIRLLAGAYGMGRFRNAMGMSSLEIATDAGATVGIKRVYGQDGWYAKAVESGTVEDADVIVIFGCNLTVSCWDVWTHVVKARSRGARLIVIDPEYNIIASKADTWIPIVPTTDAALWMGLIRETIANNMLDESYVLRATVAPVLIRADNHKYLRLSDLGVGQGEGGANEPVVLDSETGEPGALSAVTKPALHGQYELDGIKVETAYDLLAKRAEEYSPEKVEEITSVPVAAQKELAEIFTSGKAVAAFTAYGTNAYWNGVKTGHAFATFIALTGQIGRPGTVGNIISCGDPGYKYWPGGYTANVMYMFPGNKGLGAPSLSILDLPEVVRRGGMTKYGKEWPSPRTLWTANNVYSSFLSTYGWEEILPSVEMVVHSNRTWCDTITFMADYALPVCHWFETRDVHIGFSSSPYQVYCEKAIEPQFESKPDMEIRALIASACGKGEYFGSYDEMLAEVVAFPGVPSIEDFKRERIFRYCKEDWYPNSIDDGTITTPTGRFEFYNEAPVDWLGYALPEESIQNICLPSYEPSHEAAPESEASKDYPFLLMQNRYRYLIHSQYYDVDWLRELDNGDPYIDINPEDAEKYGIEDMDFVKVSNARGHAVARAHHSDGVRPGTLVFPQGFQSMFLQSGHFHSLHAIDYNPETLNTNFTEVRVRVEKWEEQ